MRRPDRDLKTCTEHRCIQKNTKNKRIKRHNDICNLIMNNISKEHAIFRKPEIEADGNEKCKSD